MGKKTFRIFSKNILQPEGAFRAGMITINGGIIENLDFSDRAELFSRGKGRRDTMQFEDAIVTPGFIDLHIHGGLGSDFMDGDQHSFINICRYHAAGGTTSLLATTAAAPLDKILKVLATARILKKKSGYGAQVLGVHLEGPFFNMEYKGCHLPEYVRNPSPREVRAMLRYADIISRVSLSPEIPYALETTRLFRKHGAVVAVGHSGADYKVVDKGIKAGMTHSTHLFNAMSRAVKKGPSRIPGVLETILVRPDITAEIIADGLHVHPYFMSLAIKAKGWDKVCTITDAMRGAGMPPGVYAFGPKDGKKVIVKNGMAVVPEGTGYASSVIRMNQTVQTLVKQIGTPPADALRMASFVPARIMGIHDHKGQILPGHDADLVVLDKQFNVIRTIVGGKTVFKKG